VLERLTLYGDYRFRLEGDFDRPGADDRRRARLRVRLGANYSVSDELLVGGRVTTGDPDALQDSNATLGDGFSNFELTLDRLFLTWTPADYDTLSLTLGKFAHSFARNPVYEELLWYSDVQPDGALLGSTWRDVGPFETVRAQAGFYVFREQAQGDVDLSVAEVLGSTRVTETARLDLSAAWYGYSNPGVVVGTTVDEYQLLDVIAALTIDDTSRPWIFSAEGIGNVGVHTDADTGWALGVSYGQIRETGDWRVYYQYQEIGDDAVFAPLADGDFLVNHNFRGHVFNADYRVTGKSTLRLRVLQATALDEDRASAFAEDPLRVRLDYSVKF